MVRPMAEHTHDHGNCSKSTLLLAEAACEERGARLTPIRRRVLRAVADAHQAIGAYEIIDVLAAEDGTRPAPITVYRALDFLMEQGFVHRLASKNAYLACDHSHEVGDNVVFLICEACGSVEELGDRHVSEALSAAASAVGFRVRQPVLEISGRCARCAHP